MDSKINVDAKDLYQMMICSCRYAYTRNNHLTPSSEYEKMLRLLTAMACKETGRNYIGFEIDKNYWEIANNRLKGVTQRDKELEDETGVKFESLW